MGSSRSFFDSVSNFFQNAFEKFGMFTGRHPKLMLFLCLITTVCLGVGIMTLDQEESIEVLYTPLNSRASQDRDKYIETFPEASRTNFLSYSSLDFILYVEIIFTAKDCNVFSDRSIHEIRKHISSVKATNASIGDETFYFKDVCAMRNGECAIAGELLTTEAAFAAFQTGKLTYPRWQNQRILGNLGDVYVEDGNITSAKHLKVTFYLRQDSDDDLKKSLEWEKSVLDVLEKRETRFLEMNYAISQSLDLEVDANSSGDIYLFIVTFVVMIAYACLVVGGDLVSTRTWPALAGVMAAVFSIVSALGLISLCGVKYVNAVGVMPFLIIGVGVNDMFLLMSSWADTYSDKDYSVVYRMGQTFRSAGIGITITSLTDLLAFVTGYTSVFVGVKNFCVYMGVAIIFCYIYQCLLFGSCLALHGHRVDQNRHCITCRVTKSRDQLRDEGKSEFSVLCCGGSKPTQRGQDERFLERLPRIYLPKVLNTCGFFVVGILFLGYIGVSIWGVINFKQGIDFRVLSSEESYYYKFSEVNIEHFDQTLSLAFVFGPSTNYVISDTIDDIDKLFDEVESYENIQNDSLVCWLNGYRASPFHDDTSENKFINGLKQFLQAVPVFKDDIVFDRGNSSIESSRCFLFTVSTSDSNVQADIMTWIRDVVDSSPLSVYVFTPFFVYFEQYVVILSNTLQTVGIALVVMIVVTFVFLPNPFLVFLVVINILSILLGIFGSLHFWDLTLSSVTMIQLIMSVGFSVDFSVHVCSSYILTEGSTRREKTKSAITHAASPILNGALSSFFGVAVLIFSESYIFQSFLKIMSTVLLFGAIHAVLFLPVLLCLVGPQANVPKTKQVSPAKPKSHGPGRKYPKHPGHSFNSDVDPIWFSPDYDTPYFYMSDGKKGILPPNQRSNAQPYANGDENGIASPFRRSNVQPNANQHGNVQPNIKSHVQPYTYRDEDVDVPQYRGTHAQPYTNPDCNDPTYRGSHAHSYANRDEYDNAPPNSGLHAQSYTNRDVNVPPHPGSRFYRYINLDGDRYAVYTGQLIAPGNPYRLS